jgi:hypothetical protein
VGALLLAFGRRLYWLFVGGIGFAAGFAVATRLTEGGTGWMPVLVGLAAGLVGIVLALLLQRLAVAAAGFAAGAWLGAGIWDLLAAAPPRVPWLPALVAGVLGAVLASTLFDSILVVLSSLVGAALIARLVEGGGAAQGVVFVALALLGVLLQSRTKRREA